MTICTIIHLILYYDLYVYFRGNQCVNCAQPFVYSSVSFEILPLVEFELEPGITDKEALWLIESESGSSKVSNSLSWSPVSQTRRLSVSLSQNLDP